MRILRSPCVFYPLGLLLVVWIGSTILQNPACTQLSERDRTAYGPRPQWLSLFDAASAVCSAGLTLIDLREQYTPAGRWALTALGIAGAMLHIVALRVAVMRRVGWGWSARGVAIAAACLLIAILVGTLRPDGMRVEDDSAAGVRHAVAAYFGVGVLNLPPSTTSTASLLTCALLGSVGLAALVLSPERRTDLARGRGAMFVGVGVVICAAALCLAASGIHMFEHPRAESGWRGHGTRETGQQTHATVGFVARITQVALAAHAGWTPLPVSDRAASEGTKLVLALTVLVGGVGAASGGALWLIVIALGGARVLTRGLDHIAGVERAARRALAAVFALVLIVTFGLLLIEARVASRFEAPATLGDAVLEAASAVGGAALTSGLAENLTSAHLSKGMGQTVDSYLYATVWIMLAMFAGRIVPVVVLSVGTRPDDDDRAPHCDV